MRGVTWIVRPARCASRARSYLCLEPAVAGGRADHDLAGCREQHAPRLEEDRVEDDVAAHAAPGAERPSITSTLRTPF
jgi:hypothetical protein